MLSKIFSRLRLIKVPFKDSLSKRYAIGFLSCASCLASLNDNLFKFLAIYVLIGLQGIASTQDILCNIGLVYVIPFILFSSVAGILSDWMSKHKLIVAMKAFEVLIIIGAFFVVACEWAFGCYLVLFLLSLQSAFLTPPKCSIIPELVKKEQISKANGWLQSCNYLAIIVGTFLASFLTQITQKNYLAVLFVCLLVALIGFVASLYIPETVAQKRKEKINPLGFIDVFRTIRQCKSIKYLNFCVFGSAFFFFLGSYMQLNMIPFAMESLGMDEVTGGYLFLAVSVGIAIGSAVAGKINRKGIDLGFALFSLGILGLLIFCLTFATQHILISVGILTLLGFFGGFYVIPLESFIQAFSKPEMRGKVVGAENFLSFVGVLLAPLCLALFSKVLGISATMGLVVMGAIVLCTFLFMVRKASSAFVHFVSRRFIQPFFTTKCLGHSLETPENKRHVVFCRSDFWFYYLVLCGQTEKLSLHVVRERPEWYDFILRAILRVSFYYTSTSYQMKKPVRWHDINDTHAFFLFDSKRAFKEFSVTQICRSLKECYPCKIVTVKEKIPHTKQSWKQIVRRFEVTLDFQAYHSPLLKTG